MYIAKEREFFFPIEIVEAARERSISAAELREMVRKSTRITHPNANRRWNSWIFMVEGDRVTAFGSIEDPVVVTPARDGVPCPRCNDGLKKVEHACPECNGKKLVKNPNQFDRGAKWVKCDGCGGVGKIIVFDSCGYCSGTGSV